MQDLAGDEGVMIIVKQYFHRCCNQIVNVRY